MITGAHSMIHPLGVTGFNRLTALSTFSAIRDKQAGRSMQRAVDSSGRRCGNRYS